MDFITRRHVALLVKAVVEQLHQHFSYDLLGRGGWKVMLAKAGFIHYEWMVGNPNTFSSGVIMGS